MTADPNCPIYLLLVDDVNAPVVLLRLPEDVTVDETERVVQSLFVNIVFANQYPLRDDQYLAWHREVTNALRGEVIPNENWYALHAWDLDVYCQVFLGHPKKIAQSFFTNEFVEISARYPGHDPEPYERLESLLAAQGFLPVPNLALCFT